MCLPNQSSVVCVCVGQAVCVLAKQSASHSVGPVYHRRELVNINGVLPSMHPTVWPSHHMLGVYVSHCRAFLMLQTVRHGSLAGKTGLHIWLSVCLSAFFLFAHLLSILFTPFLISSYMMTLFGNCWDYP